MLEDVTRKVEKGLQDAGYQVTSYCFNDHNTIYYTNSEICVVVDHKTFEYKVTTSLNLKIERLKRIIESIPNDPS